MKEHQADRLAHPQIGAVRKVLVESSDQSMFRASLLVPGAYGAANGTKYICLKRPVLSKNEMQLVRQGQGNKSMERRQHSPPFRSTFLGP